MRTADICMHGHTYIHTYTHNPRARCICVCTNAYEHMYACSLYFLLSFNLHLDFENTYLPAFLCVRVSLHASIRLYMCVQNTHTHTCLYICIYMYICLYIYIYIYIYITRMHALTNPHKTFRHIQLKAFFFSNVEILETSILSTYM
jgi:hypothetical protein